MVEKKKIPINISVRHIHLSRAHVEILFGPGYQLHPKSDLSQPGQFACEETVTLVGPKNKLQQVRILGPERDETQVEISRSDEFLLGIDAPIRQSGHLADTPGLQLIGSAGSVDLDHGVIQALRHIHMSPEDGEHFGVKDKDWVMVRVGGERGIIFDDVLVRIHPSYSLDMHLDTDEANAADLKPGSLGTLIKSPTEVQPDPND
jgi:propanediol utilization protein